jgi:hypothetical protein
MKTDLTRSTFSREKHYSSVRMQQGRVQLDSDWNEQLDIEQHADTTTRLDVIGRCGAPEGAPGFELGVTPDGSDLTISPGRIYVDGILCELETTPVAVTGASGKNLRLDAIVADGHRFEPGDWVSLVSDGANAATVAQLATVDAAKDQVTFAAGGPTPAALKALAQAKNPTLTWVCTYLTQPDFPGVRPAAIGLKAGAYLGYLDVWQRNVTALDDPLIRETALGGPDTATRIRTVWQLLLFPTALSGGTKAPSCKNEPSQFPAASSGRLRARAEPETTSSEPCTVPPGAGFRRLENQLYRVEIHEPGARGKATFKWSRENGSVVVRWLGDKGSAVVVDGLGRDEVLGIAQGDLVELASDLDELAGTPGVIATVNGIDPPGPDGTSLTLASAPPAFPGDGTHAKARRWENVQSTGAGWITLEDGVDVEFADGVYSTGDYWLIPARTATGDVEWPNDGGDPDATPAVPPSPLFRAPAGVQHDYCKLAALTFGKAWTVNAVCRPTFPPLTHLPAGGAQVDPGIHVLSVATVAGVPLRNDSPVRGVDLAAGIEIVCDGDVEPGTVVQKPTVLVSLELPYPLLPVEFDFWKAAGHIAAPFGTFSVTLDGACKASGARIEWAPSSQASLVVRNVLTTLAKSPWSKRRLLVRLALKGNFVYGAGDPKLDLDGEVFGVLKDGTLDVQLPQSGDGRRGGDLEMWFWLVPSAALNGIVLGVLAGAPNLKTAALQQATPKVVDLAIDRVKLKAAVPAPFEIAGTTAPDLAAARKAADAVGLQQLTPRVAVDDRLTVVREFLVQPLAQIGVHVEVQTVTADAIPSLAAKGFDVVVAGQDVLDAATQANPGLLAANGTVTL